MEETYTVRICITLLLIIRKREEFFTQLVSTDTTHTESKRNLYPQRSAVATSSVLQRQDPVKRARSASPSSKISSSDHSHCSDSSWHPPEN